MSALLRSLLFAPADAERKLDKAVGSAADCVIADLEDSVAPAAKAAARRTLVERLMGARVRPLAVRINAWGTPWYFEDLAAVVPQAPDYLLLPKCRGPLDLERLAHHLDAFEIAAALPQGRIRILALVTEDAASLIHMDYRQHPRLAALCFGAEDLAADLGIEARTPDGFAAPLSAARTRCLLTARAAGVAALDTPFPDPRDADGLAAELRSATACGFDGKLCIHPDQIAAVNAAFSPSAAQLDWAERVLTAFAEAPGSGVLLLEGRMIDVAHARGAARLRARAGMPVR